MVELVRLATNFHSCETATGGKSQTELTLAAPLPSSLSGLLVTVLLLPFGAVDCDRMHISG